MKAKKHIVGFRVDDDELAKIQAQVEHEHLGYVSTLIRRATFWYIGFMNEQKPPIPRKTVLNEQQNEERG